MGVIGGTRVDHAIYCKEGQEEGSSGFFGAFRRTSGASSHGAHFIHGCASWLTLLAFTSNSDSHFVRGSSSPLDNHTRLGKGALRISLTSGQREGAWHSPWSNWVPIEEEEEEEQFRWKDRTRVNRSDPV